MSPEHRVYESNQIGSALSPLALPDSTSTSPAFSSSSTSSSAVVVPVQTSPSTSAVSAPQSVTTTSSGNTIIDSSSGLPSASTLTDKLYKRSNLHNGSDISAIIHRAICHNDNRQSLSLHNTETLLLLVQATPLALPALQAPPNLTGLLPRRHPRPQNRPEADRRRYRQPHCQRPN
jgi:hypothetical protein